jgi:hypothetical protein
MYAPLAVAVGVMALRLNFAGLLLSEHKSCDRGTHQVVLSDDFAAAWA